MHKPRNKKHACRLTVLTVTLLITSLQGGCQLKELSLVNWNSLDPTSYAEWAKDEEYETTWYQHSAHLKELRRESAELPIEEQKKHLLALGDNLAENRGTPLQLELVDTIGAFDIPESILLLGQASQADNPDVRIAACRQLAAQSSPERVDLLLARVVGDTHKDVRIAAMRALEHCQSAADQPKIRESLRNVLDDEDPAVQFAAAESLEGSSGLDLNGTVRLWKEVIDGDKSEQQAYQDADSMRGSYVNQFFQSGVTFSDVMPWNWFAR